MNLNTVIRPRLIAIAALLVSSTAAFAATDPTGDLLPSFTGAPQYALDIVSADVVFDPSAQTFHLSAETAGTIAGATNAAYVFGFDTGGALNQPFGSIGFPDVAFNAVAVLGADGSGSIGANTFAATVYGNTISADIDAGLLPSLDGRAATDFRWALWSIDSSIAGLARNADFAPNAGMLNVSPVPEPQTWALMAAGLGLMSMRRKRAHRD